jgi:hypothetical protein
LGSTAQGVVGHVDGVGVQLFPEQCDHPLFVDLGTLWHSPDFLPGLLGDIAGTPVLDRDARPAPTQWPGDSPLAE